MLGIVSRIRQKPLRMTSQMKAASTLGACIRDSPGLSVPCQIEFLSKCWDLQLVTADNDSTRTRPYQSYIRHYKECCVNNELSNDLKHLTHLDLANIVELLSHTTDEPYEEVVNRLMSIVVSVDNQRAAKTCINFVGKAILLLNLADWSTGISLKDFVRYAIVSGSSQKDRFQLPLSFNARSFSKLAAIDIKWERDLLCHLSTGDDMDSLRIFQYAKVLDLYEGSRFNSILPSDFIAETRETMALLLPLNDRASRKWFKQEQQRHSLDSAVGNQPALRREYRHIQRFSFWRDRLIIAKEMFDTSQPSNLAQYWRDNRNPVQWWTFWIAGAVFVLTWISVIEGALQVYKAYYPST